MDARQSHPRLASLATAILFGLAGVWLLASPRGAPRGDLEITTIVPLRSRIEKMDSPVFLSLSPEDVQRGWIELPAGSRLTVYNNCQSGYRLILEVMDTAWLDRLQLRAQGRETWVLNAGGSMFFPWEGSGRKILELSYRFELRAGTSPGIYPWPLRLSAASAIAQ
jgi:hypothetical protein